jgi:hypothetical protein
MGRTKRPRNLIGRSDWKPIVTVPESLPENDLCPANGTAEFPSRKCGRGTEFWTWLHSEPAPYIAPKLRRSRGKPVRADPTVDERPEDATGQVGLSID